MKFLLLTILALSTVNTAEVEKDENVLVLNDGNFDGVIAEHQFVLVEFYAPWCGHCKSLAPEYKKAATALTDKDSPVKLAMVDATQNSNLGEKYEVRGYPTLKFFKNGKPTEYNGGRTADTIVTWVEKKTGPPAVTLGDVDAAKKFIEDNEVCVVGYFKNQESAEAKAFLETASNMDDIKFGITSEDTVINEYATKGAADGKVLLFKKFDEGLAVFDGEFTAEGINAFIISEAMPSVVEFNHETAQKIFSGDIKSHLLVFESKLSDEWPDTKNLLGKIAKDFKGKLLFVTVDTNEDDHKRILEFFGMKEDELPGMRLIKMTEDMAKYKPDDSSLTDANIRTFVNKFLAGELKQHLLSEEIPEDWNANNVKVLVGKNFADIAMDEGKDVLVEFYAPWCGHCKQLVPIYDQLGEAFAGNENVVIAKMDSTANELEEIKVQGFPTIKLFKKGTNQVIDYNGERTLEGFKRFLESGGVDGASAEPEDEGDEGDEENGGHDEL